MKKREMIAFLKSEGWGSKLVLPLGSNQRVRMYKDPKRNIHFGLHYAFAIASRRKSARDTRRLKAAGWTYGDFACFVHEPAAMGWWHPKHPDRHTKSEALKLLEAGNE